MSRKGVSTGGSVREMERGEKPFFFLLFFYFTIETAIMSFYHVETKMSLATRCVPVQIVT